MIWASLAYSMVNLQSLPTLKSVDTFTAVELDVRPQSDNMFGNV